MDPEYVTVTSECYSIANRREAVFRLTYQITPGPRPGVWKWFLVNHEEVGESGEGGWQAKGQYSER